MNEHIERMVEEMQIEHLERLFFLLKMEHLAKDPKAHMEEVQETVASLNSFFRTALTSAYNAAIERVVEILDQESENRWDDCIHCSCLPAATVDIEKEKIESSPEL